VALLRSLCDASQLPRLQNLIGDCRVCIDAVTSLPVAILDHFVQQAADDPQRLAVLSPVAPQLQTLVHVLADDTLSADVCENPAAQIAQDICVRAARVLVRIDWPVDEESSTGELPTVTAFGHRANVLTVLAEHSQSCQVAAAGRFAEAGECREQLHQHVNAGGLIDTPTIGPARLSDLGCLVDNLMKQRTVLVQELSNIHYAYEGVLASLEQRGIRHGLICNDVDELRNHIALQLEHEQQCHEAQMSVKNCEEEVRMATQLVDTQLANFKDANSAVQQAVEESFHAEEAAVAASGREAELAETCHNAPAQLERFRLGFMK